MEDDATVRSSYAESDLGILQTHWANDWHNSPLVETVWGHTGGLRSVFFREGYLKEAMFQIKSTEDTSSPLTFKKVIDQWQGEHVCHGGGVELPTTKRHLFFFGFGTGKAGDTHSGQSQQTAK